MQGEKRAVIYHLVRHKASAFELKQSPDGISFGVSCVETRTICNALQSVWCLGKSWRIHLRCTESSIFGLCASEDDVCKHKLSTSFNSTCRNLPRNDAPWVRSEQERKWVRDSINISGIFLTTRPYLLRSMPHVYNKAKLLLYMCEKHEWRFTEYNQIWVFSNETCF